MPQNQRIPLTEQPWEHRYVAIFKCSPKEKSATEIVVADGAKISKNADLKRVLGVLQQGMISKREYPGALNPTIRYANFQKPKAKKTNQAQVLLDDLLKAQTDAAVRKSASDLARHYVGIPNVQKGVLIFLLSILGVKEKRASDCIFIFKCDFEDISQLTPKQIFRRVKDAFEEQAKKGAQYPYFDGQKFDRRVLRVFDALGETQYWLKFLELVPPQTDAAKLQSALISTLGESHPRLIEKYGDTLKSLDRERPLATDERVIEAEDLLGPRDVMQMIDALPGDSKVSLSLDRANVTVPLKEYGRKWMIAGQDGTHYILIKGAHLEIHDPMLNVFDLGGLANLRQAAVELGMQLR